MVAGSRCMRLKLGRRRTGEILVTAADMTQSIITSKERQADGTGLPGRRPVLGGSIGAFQKVSRDFSIIATYAAALMAAAAVSMGSAASAVMDLAEPFGAGADLPGVVAVSVVVDLLAVAAEVSVVAVVADLAEVDAVNRRVASCSQQALSLVLFQRAGPSQTS